MFFVVCVVGILFFYTIKVLYLPVIYPIKSLSKEITFVYYGGYYPNKPVITLKHYIEEVHVVDYVLSIENGIYIQEPQFYKLPELNEGVVEVNIEFGGTVNGSFSIPYSQASDFYKNGLLVYLTDNDSNISTIEGFVYYDLYLYFISGESKICYFKEAGSSEWSITTSSPQLRKIPRDERPYLIWYSGWKENKWVEKQGRDF